MGWWFWRERKCSFAPPGLCLGFAFDPRLRGGLYARAAPRLLPKARSSLSEAGGLRRTRPYFLPYLKQLQIPPVGRDDKSFFVFNGKETGEFNRVGFVTRNGKGCDIGYALAASSCEEANSVDACTVTALDATTAFAVPNPG
jgi:hypothetical protein